MKRHLLPKAAGAGTAVALFGAVLAPAAHAHDHMEPHPEFDELFIEYVNEAREAEGLEPLEVWEPLGEVESGAQDWSYLQEEHRHIWHNNEHITTGAANAGCIDSGENVGVDVYNYAGAQEHGLTDLEGQVTYMFEGYQDSEPHWENILDENWNYIVSSTITQTYHDPNWGEVTRTYNTHRFAVECSEENIPGDPAPEPEDMGPENYDGLEPLPEPDNFDPPLQIPTESAEPESEDPAINVEPGTLRPGSSYTVSAEGFTPGEYLTVGINILPEDSDDPLTLTDFDASDFWTFIPDTGAYQFEQQLQDADDEVWEEFASYGFDEAYLVWELYEDPDGGDMIASGQEEVAIDLSEEPAPSDTPSPTDSPEPTSSPEPTGTADPSESPRTSETPTGTQSPDEPSPPANTTAPAETETPAPTEDPTQSPEPQPSDTDPSTWQPHIDDLTANTEGLIEVDPLVVEHGEQITVTVPEEHAGQPAEVYVFSDPVHIGTATVNSRGAFTLTVGESADPGEHLLAVYTENGHLIGWETITVTAAELGPDGAPIAAEGDGSSADSGGPGSAPASDAAGTQPGGLAATGVQTSTVLLGLGALLVVGLGIGAVALSRRGKG